MLIGKQLDMKLRTELSGITPLWRSWPNNLWLVDVKQVLPEIRRELPEIPEVDSKKPQDSTAEITPELRGEILGTQSWKPKVMTLRRTRPVWETLERNLAR